MESTRTLEILELVGGALCLDFANTVNSRVHMEHDYLIQYSDLVGWASKVGLLSPTETNRIQKRARQNEDGAKDAFAKALRTRELLYRLFSSAAGGSEPDQKDRETFVSAYSEAISHGQLIKNDNHYSTTWNVGETFDALLWPIIYSTGELLLSEELRQVKACPGCGWLFLDTSKNQSRRWCSMNTCGARDKMKRYHKRRRTK
jgi:predicted RNA-binding Zn ribbon-like protein